jgi:membrane protein implicated in regulation of membrane protease activity
MEVWWNSLDIFEKTLWSIALPASGFFVIQMFATFLGMDGNPDVSADFSGDINSTSDLGAPGDTDAPGSVPFQLFTLRNFINFLLGLGWGGIAFYPALGKAGSTVAGAITGTVLVILVMYMFRWLSKMTQSGNLDIRNAIGREAEVYLSIPENNSGRGKVHVSVQGTLRELDAGTTGEKIPTGSRVKVISVSNNLLIVEKI